MSARKFDPIKEFAGLRDSLSHSLGQSVGVVAGNLYPLVDIYETDESVIVRTAPLDGELENVEVMMEDDLLLITGATQPDDDLPRESYLQRERRFGKFSRVLRIPRAVHAEQAVARCKKGVLTITLPKVEDNYPENTGVDIAG
jgi:HSP20 family protein